MLRKRNLIMGDLINDDRIPTPFIDGPGPKSSPPKAPDFFAIHFLPALCINLPTLLIAGSSFIHTAIMGWFWADTTAPSVPVAPHPMPLGDAKPPVRMVNNSHPPLLASNIVHSHHVLCTTRPHHLPAALLPAAQHHKAHAPTYPQTQRRPHHHRPPPPPPHPRPRQRRSPVSSNA